MTDTCKFPECAIAKRLKIKSVEECPNHVSTWWNQKDQKPVLISDCAPQRTMFMIQDLYNRLIGVQQSQEEQRNALQPLDDLAEVAREYKKALSRTSCLDINLIQSTT